MRPDEIAERLGLSRYTVTQLLLSAKDRARR
jgi:DNA-binding CsgD family transcriptional regulator